MGIPRGGPVPSTSSLHAAWMVCWSQQIVLRIPQSHLHRSMTPHVAPKHGGGTPVSACTQPRWGKLSGVLLFPLAQQPAVFPLGKDGCWWVCPAIPPVLWRASQVWVSTGQSRVIPHSHPQLDNL